jgi:hypothetical protein
MEGEDEPASGEGQRDAIVASSDQEGRTSSPSGEVEEERAGTANDAQISAPAPKKQRLGRADHDIIQ